MSFGHEKGCGGYTVKYSVLGVDEGSASLSNKLIRDEKAPDIHREGQGTAMAIITKGTRATHPLISLSFYQCSECLHI